MEKEIAAFCYYLKAIKNLSDNTIAAYSSDLREFCAVSGFSGEVNEITRLDIETSYIANLADCGKSPASRARKLSSLRSFFDWAVKSGLCEKNIADEVDIPKIPHKEVRVMSKEEMMAVMDSAMQSSIDSPEIGFRDLSIIMLLFSTGIRREELTEVKLDDVNLSESSLLIHGKGNKERIVYFNDTTRSILSEYILVYREETKTAKESEYLFVSKKDKKLCASTVNRIVNKHFEAAGIKDKGFTVHSARKAFATTVYENTGDVFVVQQLLGHSSPSTTQRYVGVAESRKRQAAMTVNF